MKQRVLLDTGPLVAILSERDAHHAECVEQLRTLSPPLLTCWPVLTEAAWLLRGQPRGLQSLLKGGETGVYQLLPLDETALPWLAKFLSRYQNVGAQLADAALVYLAEREGIDLVFTLDRRDFSIYRFGRNRSFRLLPAP
ncbi:MAG TPA: PIN domain-containing protein [Gemmataceae bacterium]|nr:PIN domain-containing protein [Gemmataceae bacterium]